MCDGQPGAPVGLQRPSLFHLKQIPKCAEDEIAEESDRFLKTDSQTNPWKHEIIISGAEPGVVFMQPLQHLSVNWCLGTSNFRAYL